MAKNNIECPVDFVSINERKARLTAGLVFILTVIFLLTDIWIIPAFLALDFFVRGFNLGRYSLLGLSSDLLIRIFNIKPKPTDQAPKRFAAKIGFLFSISIVASFAFKLNTLAVIISLVMASFALLESAFAFCAGCHVYNLYNNLTGKKTPLYSVTFIIGFASFLQTAIA